MCGTLLQVKNFKFTEIEFCLPCVFAAIITDVILKIKENYKQKTDIEDKYTTPH